MSKFKVGDKVRAITNNYEWTTKNKEWEGVVTDVGENYFRARTTWCLCKDIVGDEYGFLNYERFELCRESKVDTSDTTCNFVNRYSISTQCFGTSRVKDASKLDLFHKLIIKDYKEHEGEEEMELETIDKKNLKEAKKQFDIEKANAEIEFAKRKLRQLVDTRDELQRKINDLSESKAEIEKQIALFK
jgi:hypothetical protein